MPIRFRCVYCNQLMGIARRKGGTVVKCPTCNGQVVVPGSDAERTEEPQEPSSGQGQAVAAAAAASAPAATGGPAGPAAFEQSNFDDVLREPEPKPKAEAAAKPATLRPAAAAVAAAAPAYDVERVDPAQMMPVNSSGTMGLVLSPARLALLVVIFILLLALAFGAGIVVGKNLAG